MRKRYHAARRYVHVARQWETGLCLRSIQWCSIEVHGMSGGRHSAWAFERFFNDWMMTSIRAIDHLACFRDFVEVGQGSPGPVTITLPSIFSFVADPQRALESIHQVAAAALKPVPRIQVDAQHVEQFDTCAGGVLTALLLEAASRGTSHSVSVPQAAMLRSRLAAAGVRRLLDAEESRGFPKPAMVALQSGGRNLDWNDDKLEEVTNADALRIPDRLDTWLIEHGMERVQTVALRKHLTKSFVEAVENAATHTESDWWMCSHIEQEEGKDPRVHATVFNFGQSLASSFNGTPEDAPTKVAYRALVQEHEQRDGFDEGWTPEDLLALLAIQDGSTSRVGQRGGGTLHALTLFEYLLSLSPRAPRMCWISGTTGILLDGRYTTGPSPLEVRKTRRDIAFNEANDLRLRPNPAAVTNLGRSFPGTLMTLQFDLCDCFLDHVEVSR